MSDREAMLVELVDPAGDAVGSSTVEDAHRAPGRLHRAFSVVLVDPAGRVLLQQRAAAKTRFALRWANACCGHPAPGEPVDVAASRRLAEELGIASVPLTEVGVHVYAAEDPQTGRVEQEYDHVLIGELDPAAAMAPDPAEVATVSWVSPAELDAGLAGEPSRYAPWLAGVVGACFR
jgi:isopentenyl-diphosphate delta-isomerase